MKIQESEVRSQNKAHHEEESEVRGKVVTRLACLFRPAAVRYLSRIVGGFILTPDF